MQNILALQAMELDAASDAYEAYALSTLSVQCCTDTYRALISTIGG